MKKLIYLFLAVGFVFTSCEPVEDLHERIDADLENQPVQGVENYTLVDEDYEELELPYGNFNSIDEAGELIPGLLSDLFPVWGEGSLVNVSFNLYDPIVVEEYTVTPADYNAINLSEDYFSSFYEIQDFLEFQFPQAEQGDFVELTYSTIADEILYSITDEDFGLIGDELADTYPGPASSAGNYNNFERRVDNDNYWTDEMILEAINLVLTENFDGVEGQRYNVSYAIYDGEAGTESMTVEYNGSTYIAVGGVSYEISDADYDFIGDELADTYPGPAANAAQHNSFAVQSGNDNYWSEEMLLEAFNLVLMEQFPNPEEGDKYEITYAAFNGSGVSPQIMAVIFSDGEYIIDTEASVSTITTTTVFAYTNGQWDVPYTLESEDYTEMGQSYPNFDDQDEAIYKIGIFLESVYPYAEPGDYAAVAYDFYSGSTNTEYANFVFEDDQWNYIPSVVETTIQFGHNGEGWEPDNTIVYSLTSADIALIGEELIEEYPGPADNVAYFESFDVRPTSGNMWTEEMLLEAFTIVLNANFPDAEVGQKFLLHYVIFDGSTTEAQMLVIKDENGNYVTVE